MECLCYGINDVRGRCDINDNKFRFCCERIDTAYWHFQNDYEIQKQLEDSDKDDYEEIIKKYLKKLKLNDPDDFSHFREKFIVIDMWKYQDKKIEINELREEVANFNKQTKLIRNTELLDESVYFPKRNNLDDVSFALWEQRLRRCFHSMSKKMFGKNADELLTLKTDLRVAEMEINKPLEKYREQRYFNRFQFRVGRRVYYSAFHTRKLYPTIEFNLTNLSQCEIVKSTKAFIEVRLVSPNQTLCGDVIRITKPRNIIGFVF